MDELRSRLLSRIEIAAGPLATPCWRWLWSINSSGYGTLTYQGISYLAHRAAWLCWQGPIPPNLVVMHLCNVRRCLNPEHLQLGTHRDNQAMRADRAFKVAA
jgi:hypothetical protein